MPTFAFQTQPPRSARRSRLIVGLLLVLASAATHAEQPWWPDPIDPYPAGVEIDKPMAVTVDVNDDLWRSRSSITVANIEAMMARFAELGLSRVYWIVNPEDDTRLRVLRDLPPGKTTVEIVVAAAHRYGLEAFVVFKPLETAQLHYAIPPTIPLRPGPTIIHTVDGQLPVAPFVKQHPGYLWQRRPTDSWRDRTVACIKLVADSDAVTSIGPDDLRIYTGQTNGDLTLYEGDVRFSSGIEPREVGPVRVMTLSGLNIAPPARYIVVEYVDAEDGAGAFRNRGDRLVELYDTEGQRIPHMVDQGPRTRKQAKEWVERYYLRHFGDADVPREWALPESYGRSTATTAFMFTGSYASQVRTLDGMSHPTKDGRVAVAKGKLPAIPVPHPIYPEVRAYWLDHIRGLIEAGVDGIDLRIDNHSTWVPEPEAYGFNEPIAEAYHAQSGKDLLHDPIDRELWRRIQGDAYTAFVIAAHRLASDHGIELQAHVNAAMGAELQDWSLNNVPTTIQWQWRRWIEDGHVDAVALKLLPFPWGSRMGLGVPFMKDVIALAQRHEIPVHSHARLQTWWLIQNPGGSKKLTAEDVERIAQRIRFVWQSRPLEGVILYEGFDFTRLDPETGEAVISPAFQRILESVRRGDPGLLVGQDWAALGKLPR